MCAKRDSKDSMPDAPGIETARIYPHYWEEGDVLLADNWQTWHSATGGLAPDDRRVMHLSSWDGSRTPTPV